MLEREALALLSRYKVEMNRQEVEQLTMRLAELEDQDGEAAEQESAEILRRIMVLGSKEIRV